MNNETYFVLKYPEKKPEMPELAYFNEMYCGYYLAIDNHSGGYPYGVELLRLANTFNTFETALEYKKHFIWAEIWEVQATLIPIMKKND